jgi:hypothetical protein
MSIAVSLCAFDPAQAHTPRSAAHAYGWCRLEWFYRGHRGKQGHPALLEVTMSQASEHEIDKIDALLETLQRERRQCTDPADILRVSESIDLRLDERLRLMRRRDGKAGGKRGGTGSGRRRYRQRSN